MRTSRQAWWLAGVVAGAAGLATSYLVAVVMGIRESPVVAVAELVIRLTPGPVVERAIRLLGHHDKAFLVTVLLRRARAAVRLGRPAGATLVVEAAGCCSPRSPVLGGVAIAVQYDAQAHRRDAASSWAS